MMRYIVIWFWWLGVAALTAGMLALVYFVLRVLVVATSGIDMEAGR